MRRLVLCLATIAAVPMCIAAPATGHYQATLCVATPASAPPSCGPAELEIQSASRAEVRVSDVVYRLHLRPRQVDVSTRQGRMEIDEFSAEYAWKGDVLSFFDADKKARYEVKARARIRSPR